MKKLLSIFILLFIMVNNGICYENPPFKISDPYVDENFNQIYYIMSNHRHNDSDSSYLNTIVPQVTDMYNLGSPTKEWKAAYIDSIYANTYFGLTVSGGAAFNSYSDNQNVVAVTTMNVISNDIKREVSGSSITLSLSDRVNNSISSYEISIVTVSSRLNTAEIEIDDFQVFRSTAESKIDDLQVFRSTAESKINSWILSQSTISSRITALEISTQSIKVRLDNLDTSTSIIGLTASNTNYVNLSGSTQTKTGGINFGGYVGISTTSPISKLTVNSGDVRVTDGGCYYFEDGSSQCTSATSTIYTSLWDEDANGDLMPVTFNTIDTYWELDSNLDLTPKL